MRESTTSWEVRSACMEVTREVCLLALAGMGGAEVTSVIVRVVSGGVVLRREAVSSWPMKPPAPVMRIEVGIVAMCVDEYSFYILYYIIFFFIFFVLPLLELLGESKRSRDLRGKYLDM